MGWCVMGNCELKEAKETAVEALDLAYSAWKYKSSRENGVDFESLSMVEKTHKLVIDYIESMLGSKTTIRTLPK